MVARKRFAAYAWFVLAFSLAVIVWGALVRATRSGAGCGENWPLCNGQGVPSAPVLSTIIEFPHRVTSGPVLGVFILFLAIAAFRVFPARHAVRRMASLAVLFTVTEALIGAALVKLGHVAGNSSGWRGVTLSVHLTNTLLLLAALALTAWLATHEARPIRAWAALVGVLLLSASPLLAADQGEDDREIEEVDRNAGREGGAVIAEMVVQDAMVEKIVAAVTMAARSGKIGDGKIFISPVEEVVRIRNGDRGEGAL